MKGKLLTGLIAAFLGIAGTFAAIRLAPHDDAPDVQLSERNPKSAKSIARKDIQQLTNKIDVLAETGQGPLVSDSTFVRRIYLDIAGRIPTLEETNSFLSSEAVDKRAELIDQLLDSPAYISHQFNFWADLLRIQSRNRIGPDLPYIDFVKDSITNNKPYDQFVRALLTASGPLMKRGNGAVGYIMRDYGMPEDNMSNTVRVFLGTRLECAQCHNHPDGDWTQRQYFEMVAFNGGVHPYMNETESTYDAEIKELMHKPELSVKMKTAIRQIVVPLHYGINGSGMGLARLPDDYQYEDGEAHEVVNAKLIFGGHEIRTKPPEKDFGLTESTLAQQSLHFVAGAGQVNSRRQLADWLTSADNERFSMVIANRLWKQAFGVGLIEPVDDIREDTIASNAKLMNFLSDQMVELEFDSKQLLRAIYLSKAYQQKSLRPEDSKFKKTLAPRFRRMKAEQIWDSLLALTADEVDQVPSTDSPAANYLGSKNIYETYERLVNLTPAEIETLAAKNLEPNGSGSYPRKHVFRIDARPAIFRQDEIYNSLTGDELFRASELMSPMPPNHLLREFGQSDREQVDNGNQEIAISQLMSLMNGFIENRLLKPDSALMKKLNSQADVESKIKTAFLSVLGREPTPAEQSKWLVDFKEFGTDALQDLVWTLANSTEFLFIQ